MRVDLDESDLRIDVFMKGGPGSTERGCSVRLTHAPTGTSVYVENALSGRDGSEEARRLLIEALSQTPELPIRP